MVCPRCAYSTAASIGRCPACGATFADRAVVTLDSPVVTTGLPTPATAAAPTTLNKGTTTMGPTVGAEPTVDRAIGVTTRGLGALAGGALRAGRAFGPRYHIIKLLGVGGMGAVYQAWDAELNVGVALKVIRTDARHRSASSEAIILRVQLDHKIR